MRLRSRVNTVRLRKIDPSNLYRATTPLTGAGRSGRKGEGTGGRGGKRGGREVGHLGCTGLYKGLVTGHRTLYRGLNGFCGGLATWKPIERDLDVYYGGLSIGFKYMFRALLNPCTAALSGDQVRRERERKR